MTKNVFSTPIAKAHLIRNAFDLSRRDVFSAKAGQLLPVVCLECNPNEHFEIRPDIFLRTQTLNTCAYARMKQKIEFFFVPYRALWFKSDQFFTTTNYSTSSVYSADAPKYFPRFPLTPKDLNQPSNTLFHWLYSIPVQESDWSRFPDSSPGITDILKLLDMLGYGCFPKDSSFNSYYDYLSADNVGQYASLLRLAAYQKIYQDHYRLPLYESYDNGCNLDDLQRLADKSNDGINFTDFNGGSLPGVVTGIQRFFTLQYASWKKDYFTNLRSKNNLYLSRWMYGPGAVDGNYADLGNLHFIGSLPSYNNDVGASGVVTSALSVRSLFAIEKLLDNMARAKDGSYSSQIEARFGVKPLIDPHLDSLYLGGSDSPVTIGEVTATASTSDAVGSVTSVLGQVAGKGTSSSGQTTISFDTKEHGIIMGIFSIVPEAEYNATGLDPMLQKFTRPEFFTPEFDKLGFAPVTLREMFLNGTVIASPFPGESDWDNTVLGFNPMYSEYKTAVDKVHGEFMSPTVSSAGSLSAWVTPRLFGEIYSSGGLQYEFLHVNPAIMDNIFAINSSEADQFLVNCYHDIRAIRPMSVNGLPYCG